jgi:L-threonylcarbamoyladenylate synthase
MTSEPTPDRTPEPTSETSRNDEVLQQSLAQGLSQALAHLQKKKILAYPTETVWGMAVDASSPEAVEALRRWKGRGDEQPISVLVSGEESLEKLGVAVRAPVRALMQAFWPGPLTLVLPTDPTKMTKCLAPGIARAGDGAVGFRCPQHPLARALVLEAEALGLGPLTSTSLNRSGEPSVLKAREAEQICKDSAGELFLLGLEAAAADSEQDPASLALTKASTVVDCCGEGLVILREGAIAEEALLPRWSYYK